MNIIDDNLIMYQSHVYPWGTDVSPHWAMDSTYLCWFKQRKRRGNKKSKRQVLTSLFWCYAPIWIFTQTGKRSKLVCQWYVINSMGIHMHIIPWIITSNRYLLHNLRATSMWKNIICHTSTKPGRIDQCLFRSLDGRIWNTTVACKLSLLPLLMA